jgi:hypothetical protein
MLDHVSVGAATRGGVEHVDRRPQATRRCLPSKVIGELIDMPGSGTVEGTSPVTGSKEMRPEDAVDTQILAPS